MSMHCQLVNPKFSRRFDQRRLFVQIADEFWIRLGPPKGISGENKMRCSSALQALKIFDCLFAVVRVAVVSRVLLEKMPAPALGIVKDGRIAHVRSYD